MFAKGCPQSPETGGPEYLGKTGGRMMVASEEGKGTTFTRYLPVR
jgi:hypothetical protein